MYENYHTLVQEVRNTNDLLETQNTLIETNISTVITFITCLCIFKAADMVHHMVDAFYKK